MLLQEMTCSDNNFLDSRLNVQLKAQTQGLFGPHSTARHTSSTQFELDESASCDSVAIKTKTDSRKEAEHLLRRMGSGFPCRGHKSVAEEVSKFPKA